LDIPPALKNALPPKRAEEKSSTEQVKEASEVVRKEDQVSRPKKRKLSKRVKRNRTIAALLLVAIVTGVWYLLIGPGNRVVVPSVAGMSIVKATNELTPGSPSRSVSANSAKRSRRVSFCAAILPVEVELLKVALST
jgi:serine/threonine-protein kinase